MERRGWRSQEIKVSGSNPENRTVVPLAEAVRSGIYTPTRAYSLVSGRKAELTREEIEAEKKLLEAFSVKPSPEEHAEIAPVVPIEIPYEDAGIEEEDDEYSHDLDIPLEPATPLTATPIIEEYAGVAPVVPEVPHEKSESIFGTPSAEEYLKNHLKMIADNARQRAGVYGISEVRIIAATDLRQHVPVMKKELKVGETFNTEPWFNQLRQLIDGTEQTPKEPIETRALSKPLQVAKSIAKRRESPRDRIGWITKTGSSISNHLLATVLVAATLAMQAPKNERYAEHLTTPAYASHVVETHQSETLPVALPQIIPPTETIQPLEEEDELWQPETRQTRNNLSERAEAIARENAITERLNREATMRFQNTLVDGKEKESPDETGLLGGYSSLRVKEILPPHPTLHQIAAHRRAEFDAQLRTGLY